MKIQLAYGKTGLALDIPESWNVTVIEPVFVPGLPGPESYLTNALRNPFGSNPLSEVVHSSDRVGIIFSDITRATPTPLMLQAILNELKHVPSENIILFNALGTHRRNSKEELSVILGEKPAAKYTIIQNDSTDLSTQVLVGKSDFGHDIYLNEDLVECDVQILTGFIEPHFFAGFSGGGKAVLPGMAGLTTILDNHSFEMIANPKSTWGITQGNPIWEEINQAAHFLKNTFLVNVAQNRDKQITGVYAGELDQAHLRGCDDVYQHSMVPVDEPFDIVVTTNSGYPLDLNLYQSVKGMSAAAQVVKQEGTIILASECREGIPEHGQYGNLVMQARSPQQLLHILGAPGFSRQDQWQAQIQAQILMKARVFVHSTNLTDKQIISMMMEPCHDIAETISHLLLEYGQDARIAILPEGPLTIPVLKHS